MSLADTVSRLRQPEYTGSNRCTPCTVGNLAIAVVVAGGIGLAAPIVGAGAFGLFTGIIYVRGYLVPGTPELTKRYFPARALRLFGKEPIEHRHESGGSSATTSDVVAALVAAGVVHRNGDDVSLAADFRATWRERIEDRRDPPPGPEAVRTLVGADEISRHGDRSFVVDGNRSVRWGSVAAFVADVAAASILEDRLDGWDTFEWDRRRSVLLGLRLCLERCPSCDGRVAVSDDRVDPCCQKPHLTAQSVCEDCGAALADAAVVDHGDGESIRWRLLHP